MTWKKIKADYTIRPEEEEHDPNAVMPRIIPPCESCGGTDYIIKLKPERYDSEKDLYYKWDGAGGKIYDPPGVEYIRAAAQCRKNYNYDGCATRYKNNGQWTQSVHDIIFDPDTETWMTEKDFTIINNKRKKRQRTKEKWQRLDEASE